MTETVFVGMDTSNYTTSVALASDRGEVLANLKQLLPVGEGERGLRQSDALFAHTRQLPEILRALEPLLAGKRVAAVGCSVKPRDAEESYMPCFLAGKAAATAFAVGASLPLYSFSHQSGHVMAAAYSSGRAEELLSAPFGAFHVSGGTTELLYITPTTAGFSVERIGGTLDLNAGQAIDRTGVRMGLGFPCGREMEALANQNTQKLPPIRVTVTGTECHLSGLENQAQTLYEKTKDAAYTCAFVFAYLAKTLGRMTDAFLELHPGAPVLFAGGVMSNRIIQAELSHFESACFAEPQFSADNAAGIALLTRAAWRKETKK